MALTAEQMIARIAELEARVAVAESLGDNLTAKMDGKILTIMVDTSKSYGKTASGNVGVATSHGFKQIGGVKFSLNVAEA